MENKKGSSNQDDPFEILPETIPADGRRMSVKHLPFGHPMSE